MKKPISPFRITQFQLMREALNLQAAIKESNRCLLCHDAPCSKACPAGTDPAKFIRQLKFYNYKGAARTIRNNNVLGSVCAHICPVENLCEKECSICALEDPIDIGGLQQFASEYGKLHKLEPFAISQKSSGKIAVIGAGPAGLSCAATLANLDYDVTVFERNEHAGGVPRWNIPDYRLPIEALEYDIQNLLSRGVSISYNSPVDSPEAIRKLQEQGFEAIFISTGLTEAFSLDLLNGFDNAVDYISFLKQTKADRQSLQLADKNVAVIGGGSVAIDSAISAKACGAEKVYLISLEHLGELPACAEEINLAHLMHIVLKPGCQITGLTTEGSHITQLSGVETKWKQPGVFKPENVMHIKGTEFSLNVDLVVLAIGTRPGAEVALFSDKLLKTGKGVITVNEFFETSIEGVFAGGDVVNGGGSVVQAVGDGKKAAAQIDNFIKNRRNTQ
jgi:NADPH-dependent glutamate synthase beta subunit-like oxidoreductase